MLALATWAAAVAAAGAKCDPSDAAPCSLNGDCVNGQCVCDPAWRGSAECDVLSFLPADPAAGYHNESYASWGGNVIHADGKYHLFVAQMANKCGLDHWGTNSAVVRAEGSAPGGPFTYRETIVPPFAHNPTVRELPNGGGYVLYMIGGTPSSPVDCRNKTATSRRAQTLQLMGTGIRVSHAPSVYGPWSAPIAINMTGNSPELKGGWTNPSPHFLTDGSVYFAFQAQDGKHALVGMANGTSWRGPFTYTNPHPVTPEKWYCVAGQDEDPFMWKSPRGFHIITHGMCPAGPFEAHYKYSPDGVNWNTSPRQTYSYYVDFTNGRKLLQRVERPQLFFNRTHPDGSVSNPLFLYNGVCHGSIETCWFKQAGMTYTIARPLRIG